MKKENKHLAQQKRAEQRRKQAIKNMIMQITKIGLPILVVVLLIVLIIVDPLSSKKTSTNTGNTDGLKVEGNADNTDTKTPTLSKDSSLTVADGDTVNIDYVGSIDGVEFSGGNTQGAGTDLVIGSGSYIDDFEEQLIGAHPGDTVEVNVTFPENYGKEDLNGKDALFKVVINGIYK